MREVFVILFVGCYPVKVFLDEELIRRLTPFEALYLTDKTYLNSHNSSKAIDIMRPINEAATFNQYQTAVDVLQELNRKQPNFMKNKICKIEKIWMR